MIKFHKKYFIESIAFENVNPSQIRHHNIKFRNIQNIENNLTRFQVYHETEFHVNIKIHSTKDNIPKYLSNTTKVYMTTGKVNYNAHATHQPLNEGTSYIPVNLPKNTGNSRGKVKPPDTETLTPQLRKIAIKKGASHPSPIREPDLDFRKLVDKLEQAEITMKLEETEDLKLQ